MNKRCFFVGFPVLVLVLLLCFLGWQKNHMLSRELTAPRRQSVAVLSDGRLGNQLFEYWSAYAYAKKHNKQLVAFGFEDVQKVFVPGENVVFLDGVKSVQEYYAFIGKSMTTKHTIDMTQKANSLAGYMQSYHNVKDVADDIRKQSVFKQKPNKINQDIIDKMHSENSVSVHVRRGDYVLYKYTLLPPAWYQKAIAYMNERVDEPFYYIFSDDIEWAKANLDIEEPHMFVTWNRGDESYNDMRLMTHCKHNIVANSTFSWWGAFLGAPEERIVIMPDKWVPWDEEWERYLIPPKWIVLPIE